MSTTRAPANNYNPVPIKLNKTASRTLDQTSGYGLWKADYEPQKCAIAVIASRRLCHEMSGLDIFAHFIFT